MNESKREYDIELEAGVVVRIQRDGNEIPLGFEEQSFCDFLTWAWNRPASEVGQFATSLNKEEFAGIRFFSDYQAFVDHCKLHGGMVETVGKSIKSQTLGLFPGSVKYHQLYQPEKHEILGLGDGLASKDKPFAIVTDWLHSKLTDDLIFENSEIRRLSTWPIERTFVYLDIAGFTHYPPGHQALIIKSVTTLIHNKEVFENLHESFEEMLCIGDGYIFAFDDPLTATMFSARLAYVIDALLCLNDSLSISTFASVFTRAKSMPFGNPGVEDGITPATESTAGTAYFQRLARNLQMLYLFLIASAKRFTN